MAETSPRLSHLDDLGERPHLPTGAASRTNDAPPCPMRPDQHVEREGHMRPTHHAMED